MNNKISIFDTTLRDGDQSPGFQFFPSEKLIMARQLAKLGVDVIEAGFAGSSRGDYEAIRKIAEEIGTKDGPVICSLCRTVEKDIESAAKAVENAYKPRIHTFIATSDVHIEKKFKKDRAWVLETAQKSVTLAKKYVDEVEFCCEDFGRTDLNFAVKVTETAIKAGASIINLADTVGYLYPDESESRARYVIEKINNQGLYPVFSVHNHNDLGMATANTIMGIKAGAKQVHVTVNGIGERAGNASLEEVVVAMGLKKLGECNINEKYIKETSNLCSEFTGVCIARNKAVVGENAFAHEAGIHADGVQKDPNTYELFPPENVGCKRKIVFGVRSGRNGLKWKYKTLGFSFNEETFERLFESFKDFGDTHKVVRDADLISIASDYKQTY